jgi:hypothetical protein
MRTCNICGENVIQGPRWCDWTHAHGDTYCGTGDGATANGHRDHECRPETCGGVSYDPCIYAGTSRTY